MLILLPPSEAKATRVRGATLNLDGLSHPELSPYRRQVIQALALLSSHQDAAATLGVSPNLADQIARNTRLTQAPTLRAADLYTGVLYDALDLASLTTAHRRRATRRLLIVSAVFGVLTLGDRVPPYRLSMGVNLPGIGPLAAFWRHALTGSLADTPRRGLIVDTRSSTYAAAWAPPPHSPQARRWVRIDVPGATHAAKSTRGVVARYLCSHDVDPEHPADLADLLAARFEVALHEPTGPRAPWVLQATLASGLDR